MRPKTRKLLTTAALSTGAVLIPACIPLPGIAAPLEQHDPGLSMDATADAPPDHAAADAGGSEGGRDAASDGAREGG